MVAKSFGMLKRPPAPLLCMRLRKISVSSSFTLAQKTSALTADPKLRVPTAFRCARQGIHDAIVGGAYGAEVAKKLKLNRWMSISPDYSYGRDTTTEYFEHLKQFNKGY